VPLTKKIRFLEKEADQLKTKKNSQKKTKPSLK